MRSYLCRNVILREMEPQLVISHLNRGYHSREVCVHRLALNLIQKVMIRAIEVVQSYVAVFASAAVRSALGMNGNIYSSKLAYLSSYRECINCLQLSGPK
jgi:hypothetical protein